MTNAPKRNYLTREEEHALVVRALDILLKAVASTTDRRWQHHPGAEDRHVVIVPSMLGPELVAEQVKPEYADVITLAVPAARGLIAVLQDVKLIMNAYPTPEAVRGEIARGVRLAKLIVGDA